MKGKIGRKHIENIYSLVIPWLIYIEAAFFQKKLSVET